MKLYFRQPGTIVVLQALADILRSRAGAIDQLRTLFLGVILQGTKSNEAYDTVAFNELSQIPYVRSLTTSTA